VDGEGDKGAVVAGSEGAGEKEKVSREEAKAEKETVKDPVAEIKKRIEEAKANKVWNSPYMLVLWKQTFYQESLAPQDYIHMY